MEVLNNSHYYNFNSRLYNTVLDPCSFPFEASKRNGYFQRLYFEFLYTNKVNGITFYYTCTYNDKSIPKFLGYNVFSYSDIRLVTNGLISKRLSREFGARLRYFCACETGEGGETHNYKGVRGAGNNPHYHFIFFVQPLHDENNQPIYDGYKRPLVQDFEPMLKKVWTGFECWFPWKLARFGSVCPGRFGAEVTDARAFRYVSKYSLKDNQEFEVLKHIRDHYYHECISKGMDFQFWRVYYQFFRSCGIDYNKYEFFEKFDFIRYHAFYKRNIAKFPDVNYNKFVNWYASSDVKVFVAEASQWFDSHYINEYVDYYCRRFVANYSGKIRCSKTLGFYGLGFVESKSVDPRLTIPLPKKFEVQKPCLFYIRKLYYDVIKCPVTGNILYRLNDLGKSLKINSLDRLIQSKFNSVREHISRHEFYKKSIPLPDNSGVGSSNFCYSPFQVSYFIHSALSGDVIEKYSIYCLVYKHRFYNGDKIIDYHTDFASFLDTDVSVFDFDDNTISFAFFNLHGYRSYLSHPYFSVYKDIFLFLDQFCSVYDSVVSDNKRSEFNDHSAYLKRLNASIHNLPIQLHL